jgi:malate/lactate dehydrogenase
MTRGLAFDAVREQASSPPAQARVVVVGGGGGVGASVAFNLLLLAYPLEVVLVDRRPEMAVSHAMDLEQVVPLTCGGSVRVGDLDDVADAAIVVVTASVPLRLNASRMEFLVENARILDELAERLHHDSIVLVVTNPVDALVTWLWRLTGLQRQRIVGYTFNDSLRLRTGIGAALGVAQERVEAWVLGEHGEHSVPLFGRVAVDGQRRRLDRRQRADAEAFLRGWYRRHVGLNSGRTSTWTTGLGVARMIESVVVGDGRVWPASVVLEGEYGLTGVSVGVPISLGRCGVTRIHEWELTPEERAAVEQGAATVAGAAGAAIDDRIPDGDRSPLTAVPMDRYVRDRGG